MPDSTFAAALEVVDSATACGLDQGAQGLAGSPDGLTDRLDELLLKEIEDTVSVGETLSERENVGGISASSSKDSLPEGKDCVVESLPESVGLPGGTTRSHAERLRMQPVSLLLRWSGCLLGQTAIGLVILAATYSVIIKVAVDEARERRSAEREFGSGESDAHWTGDARSTVLLLLRPSYALLLARVTSALMVGVAKRAPCGDWEYIPLPAFGVLLLHHALASLWALAAVLYPAGCAIGLLIDRDAWVDLYLLHRFIPVMLWTMGCGLVFLSTDVGLAVWQKTLSVKHYKERAATAQHHQR
ncbi:hypothetical protein EMIHUDRAFT_253572, partial [Emiliania huxleyi CCMP1516]|uniref:TLC domain-containing protein n=2 Tax=Emiliania huxleyi TaxID=2903 RepID=A0A0D3K6F7_EMIH1